MGEGERSFSKAFEERFKIRDMAMIADHNNFMTFDINNERDALNKLEAFARYVTQPLNPVLRERMNRMESTGGLNNGDEEMKGSRESVTASQAGSH